MCAFTFDVFFFFVKVQVCTAFVHAGQSINIYRYKNIKRKILKCRANLYFNKQCLKYDLVP